MAADLVEVRRLSASTVDAIVLLLLAGVLLGYAVELLRAGRADLARAVALEAATRERERLAADIHDSVLQVLAYVRRRGRQLLPGVEELRQISTHACRFAAELPRVDRNLQRPAPRSRRRTTAGRRTSRRP